MDTSYHHLDPEHHPGPGRNVRKAALTILALGAASAAVVFGSLAAWTAQTTNPGNTITAGKLTLGNDKAATALFAADEQAKPGQSGTDTVTISNDGSAPMNVTLSQSGVVDTMSDGNNDMKFTILDRATGNCVYPAAAGPCPALDAATAGADWNGAARLTNVALPGTGGAGWAAAESHTFAITWAYTDDGVVNNTTNDGSGRKAAFDLTWNGVPA